MRRVSPSGSDANRGTSPSAPLRSPRPLYTDGALVAAARSGDAVLFEGGAAHACGIDVAGGGTPAAPLRVA
eukprot:gene10309-21549_t